METNKNNGIALGRSVFFTWEQLDSIAQRWASKMFNNPRREHEVFTLVSRDEDALNIEVTNMSCGDVEIWENIFTQYDKEHEYEAMAEFETGERTATLPGLISLRIISQEIGEGCDLDSTDPNAAPIIPKGCVATYAGVFFVEKPSSELSKYFIFEEDA